MDRNASFLYQPYPNIIDKPLKINLSQWKIKSGDTIRLKLKEAQSNPIIGIFSEDSLLLPHQQLHRIPSAVEYGENVITSKSLFSEELTDIEEDFVIKNQMIVVPENARYLFLGNSEWNLFNNRICLKLNTREYIRQFEIKTIAKIKVAKRQAKILLWDDSNEDGDVVTLYLNGEEIVNCYEVLNKRKKILLNLRNGRNEFLIYAENTGKLGDNTAVLQIEGKPYRKIIHVNSKAGTAKRIIIICEE
ncbi:MAG: hypothetical protein AAF806_11605 [Bacteroidota bacterium]